MSKQPRPSTSWAIIVRVSYDNKVGRLGKLTSAIGRVGGDIGSVDLVESGPHGIVRDLTINARDEVHEHEIVTAIKALSWVHVLSVHDRTFVAHRGGKIEVVSKAPIRGRDDLSLIYTPGVARVSEAIHEDPSRACALTIKCNSVAIITDGTAVLGLGNMGPLAALPVMEGKAALFKEFAGVDAFPLCLDEHDPEKLAEMTRALAHLRSDQPGGCLRPPLLCRGRAPSRAARHPRLSRRSIRHRRRRSRGPAQRAEASE